MSLALVTSIYGDYDTLTDPPEQDGVDEYIAVVDREHDVHRWTQIVEPRPQLHPRLAAKVAKCWPFVYTGCDRAVWIDGHVRPRHQGTARWVVDHLDAVFPIAQFGHPERDCLFDEAKVSVDLRKYADTSVLAQAEHYRSLGMPTNFGLWACGVMGWSRTIPTEVFGLRWLAEQFRWSYQDQVSHPFLLWRFGLRPAVLEGSLWHSEHVWFAGHANDL